MITKIHVENFKCLKNIEVELKPLTVLIGPNGSGKSSILQSILMLKKMYVRQGNLHLNEVFQLDGYINMGLWGDVTYDAKRPLRLNMTVTRRDKDVTVSFTTILNQDASVELSAHLKVNGVEHKFKTKFSLPYTKKQPISITLKMEDGTLGVSWDGFNVTINSVSGNVPRDLVNTITTTVNAWYRDVYFVPSTIAMFRLPQVNITNVNKTATLNDVTKSIVVSETYLLQLLAMDPDLEDYVLRTAKEIFGVDIRVRPLPQNIWRVISSIRKGKTTSIVNEGGGINRNVYMFTILGLADEGSTVLLEEPETNLHPRAQYMLAKVFAEAVSSGKQLIITTHSEHLLFGILTHIARKKLRLDDTAIYYMERDSEGRTVIRKLDIDKHGRVKGGLPGFFEQDVEELLEMLREVG